MKVKSVELYGIHSSNVSTVLTKNIFTTYIPISASIYMANKNILNHYLRLNKTNLVIDNKKFNELLGISLNELNQIIWKSESKNSAFDKSIGSPGIDMVPVLNGKELLELEVKLTVVPTHAKNKITEMIIRQNTQFNLVERICYYHSSLLNTEMNFKTLKEFVNRYWNLQKPFIVHGLWKTIENKSELDKKNTMDVVCISDFGYLHMLLSSPQEKIHNGKSIKTRIGRVVDLIINWINEYVKYDKLTYKESTEGSKDHLKITLYPVDYQKDLKGFFYNLRLNFDDIMQIIPKESISQLGPERRFDSSLIFTLAQK
jgi:hypothetical protein